MPQNPFGFIPYEEPDSTQDFGFIPYDTTPEPPLQSGFRFETTSNPAYPPSPSIQQPEEQGWLDWGISQGLRTIPAVGGAMIGGTGGLLGAGVGAIPGAMAGGALGSFVGSALGQGYEYLRGQREEFNPWEAGVETAVGAIPPIFTPAKLAANAGISQALKYAGKSALTNALEGAAVSGAATPFQYAAQTGSFDAPLSNYLANAGFGAVTGGALGGTLTGIPAMRRARGLQQIADVSIPPPPDLSQPPPPVEAGPSFPTEPLPFVQPTYGPEEFGRPIQPDLPFSSPYEPRPAPVIPEAPITGPQQLPFYEPRPSVPQGVQPIIKIQEPTPLIIAEQQNRGYVFLNENPDGSVTMVRNDLAPRPAPIQPPIQQPTPVQTPTPTPATAPVSEGLPPIVSTRGWKRDDYNLWRGRGYTSAGIGPDGFLQFKAPDIAVPTPAPAPVVTPTSVDPFAMRGMPIDPNQPVVIPKQQLKKKLINSYVEQGFSFTKDANGNGIFKRLLTEEEGGSDWWTMWANLKRMLGRDPSVAEVEEGLTREPRAGEETGRVAPFIPPQRKGMDHYQLPDGRVVPTDATATKGEPVIDFALKDGTMVKARLVRRANLDEYGEPVRPTPKARQVYDAAEELTQRLKQNIENDPGVERLLTEIEEMIAKETDPAIIQDNLNQLEGYAKNSKATPDERELFGSLYEDALDRSRRVALEIPSQELYLSGETYKPKPEFPSTIQHAFDPLENRPDLSQPGLPMPLGVRNRNRLEDIADVGTKGAHEFGPTQGEFDFTIPPTRRGIRGQEGALNIGDMGKAYQDFKKKTGIGQGGSQWSTEEGKAASDFIDEALGLSKNAVTYGEYSYVTRQAMGQMHTPEFWKALGPMFKASRPWEAGVKYERMIDEQIRSNKIHLPRRDPDTGKLMPTFAEEMGLSLIELGGDLNKRGETITSRWMETGGFFGLDEESRFARGYRQTLGRIVSGSNRGFKTLNNHILTNRTEKLLDTWKDIAIKAHTEGEARIGVMPWKQKFTPEEAMDLNPYTNLPLAKDLGDFIKTSLGRAPARTHIVPHRYAEMSFEPVIKQLSRYAFAPRLFFSRVRMLNPSTYIMAPPQVRKEYLKSATAIVSAWLTMTQMMKVAGNALGEEVEVGWNPLSADFGKARIGNVRFDFGGGHLQVASAIARFLTGHYTSSATGETHRYGEGYQAQTYLDATQRFFANKLEPLTKFGYDLWNASEYQPVHLFDRTAQLFITLIGQDIFEIIRENPKLLLVSPGMFFGGGTQVYEAGETPEKIIPKEYDIPIKYGPGQLMPWNWGETPSTRPGQTGQSPRQQRQTGPRPRTGPRF